ncbi:MAG TPA: lipopolysaccharide transport periplasmic protein LptA [Burkholderiaceae bacterium]|nr:lipopolysaccharide transport periplasmic protein LptA [Burkholderiaceae bacterium]
MRKPLLPLALTCILAAAPAVAEKADRGKQMVIEANQPGTLDMARQVVVFAGSVVVAQGTMAIRAERVEVRERPDGHRSATAIGQPGKPATFRQKRDGVDEFVEGSAERIEYDSRGDVVRFVGSAQVRRLRGTTTADEITGSVITYDNGNETFNVQGSPPAAAGASAPATGRVRVVLTPRPEGPASAPHGARP